jgi:CPA2 family monovalent cation:H+ antiporter-2
MLAISGSSIIAKVIMDLRLAQQPFAQAVFGLMICDDIAAMVMLSVISGIGAQSAASLEVATFTFLRILFFVLAFLLLGLLVVPRLLAAAARFRNREAIVILVLAVCLTGALVAAKLDFSVAMGAFMAGAIVAATPQASQIEEWMHPIREMFSAIFFVSAGMLVVPRLLWDNLGPVAAIVAATLVLRTILGTVGSILSGHSLNDSIKVGASISQIGEFSFVMASLGVSLGLASDFLYPIAAVVASATMFCTPLIIQNGETLARGLASSVPGVDRSVRRYQAWLEPLLRPRAERAMETAVFARYLVRLVAYLTISAGVLLLGGSVFIFAHGRWPRAADWLWVGWMTLAVAGLPIFLLLAKYANHALLLLVTRWLSAPGRGWLFERFNVRLFYNATFAASIAAIGAVFVALAAPHFDSWPHLALSVAAICAAAAFARTWVRYATEIVERKLDEVLGLATSEPTRQAIIMLGNRQSVFYDLTEQVLLSDSAPTTGKTIGVLDLRSRTGASIAAIYRDGTHIMNPGPQTALAAHDVLIVLGDQSQRSNARALLLGEADR